MSSAEFNLSEVLEVVLNQVMILSNEREVQVTYDAPDGVASMYLYGDSIRLQQVLSDFLANALLFTPAFEGSAVLLRLIPRKKRIGSRVQIVHLEFRYFSFILNVFILTCQIYRVIDMCSQLETVNHMRKV